MSRILLIEDDQGAQLLFKSRLEDLGHQVVTAPTGARGLMEARSGPFDLFLVDVVLGSGIDGFEVCRRIKTIPQMQRIPIVLISGQLKGREDLHRGYEAGCEAFLLKGDMPLLEDVVRAMLNMKSLQDDLGLQNRLLEEQNRRLTEERRRGADLETALRESGNRSDVLRELAAGRPDGLLIVDGDGIVRYADRGALDVFGKDLEGRNLGALAPSSGLEAFVRNAHSEPREGFRFDLTRGAKTPRMLSASVLPILSGAGGGAGLRAVLILDAGRRRAAGELLRLQDQGVPRREIGALYEMARIAYHPRNLVGTSPALQEVRRIVTETAATERCVLIRGESGTGKEHVARTLHFQSRLSGPFVPMNCAALAPELIESELFGHVKGAIDGALADRPGLLQQADLGTLFLDEIDALPIPAQEKLSRALKEHTVDRVGATRPEHVAVRVIAATSVDVEQLVEEGLVSPELLEAVGQVRITIPPLRHRKEDVRVLSEHHLRVHAGPGGEAELSAEAIAAMEAYTWPGNALELLSCLERSSAVARGGVIDVGDLPQAIRDLTQPGRRSLVPTPMRATAPAGTHTVHGIRETAPVVAHGEVILRPAEGPVSLENYERMCLLAALEDTRGDKIKAAKLLGVGKSTLYRKLKTHGIT
jgi:DNA-binding NtrC family response regulator